MATDHRIDQNGQRLNFTCENRRYLTDINKGKPHGAGFAKGSVFDSSLITHGSYTLWLEHVLEKGTGAETYWLMWYDGGRPTIPLSGVLDKSEIQEMSRQLASFVP
ncbi:MAG TPA: hypothetical protein VMU87_08235 [Stellaceae bacterium]|nr:hypothetical protein [Stellaceae bacterium]